MDKYDISVIIPTFNRLGTLKRTVQHIVEQTFDKKRYEIIIIDDCSNDGTVAYLKSLTLTIPLKVICNAQNLGRARTRNVGIRAAQGEYILMIDDDIWAENNLIQMHLETHKNSSNNIAVVGAVLPSPEVQNTAVNKYCNVHHLWCYREMKAQGKNLSYAFCKTANLSLPRELLVKIGMFDERFTVYGGEDTELGSRLEKASIALQFVDAAIGCHYHHETVESLIAREYERGQSLRLYNEMHKIDLFPNRNSFFIAAFNTPNTGKSAFYNVVKLFIFTTAARLLNKQIIKVLNKNRRCETFLVKYLLPVLKIQYLYYSLNNADGGQKYVA